MAEIPATTGDDILNGTTLADLIDAGAGNDTILAGDGDDTIIDQGWLSNTTTPAPATTGSTSSTRPAVRSSRATQVRP